MFFFFSALFIRRKVACYNLIDAAGVGPALLTGTSLAMMTRVMSAQKMYPETVARVTSINNTWVQLASWKVLRGLVPEDTKKKLRVCGTDFFQTLLDDVAEGELPVRFGGTKRFAWFDPLFEFELVSVGRSAVHEVTIELAPGQTLEYVARVQSGTISLSLEFRPAGTDSTAVVPIKLPIILDAAKTPVARGTFALPAELEIGVVIIKLDNESSWVWAKTVELSTTLT